MCISLAINSRIYKTATSFPNPAQKECLTLRMDPSPSPLSITPCTRPRVKFRRLSAIPRIHLRRHIRHPHRRFRFRHLNRPSSDWETTESMSKNSSIQTASLTLLSVEDLYAGQPISTFVRKNPAFFYSSFGVLFLVFLLILFIKDTYGRKHPWNLILLGVFTLAFTYMAATLSSFFTTDSVIVAAAMTAAICLSITLFSIQTKIDFTLCSSLIFCVCLVLLYFAIACLVLRFGMVNGRVLDAVYGGAFTLVMSLVLVIDTQQIVGGKRLEMNPEEYVFGALILYIDVIYIFILLLAAFGKSD